MNALPARSLPVTSPSGPDDGSEAATGELLTEIDLGSGRGRHPEKPPVLVEVIRSLTVEDLPVLLQRAAPSSAPAGARPLVRLRHSHHQLARLIAQGVEQTEIALITGYHPAYITNIQQDPQFSELVATYAGERELAFVDVLERMKTLGLTCLEELQERIALSPEKWSHREMMELAELLLIKPQRAGQGASQSANGAGPAVSINVKFVKSDADSAMIDVTPR